MDDKNPFANKIENMIAAFQEEQRRAQEERKEAERQAREERKDAKRQLRDSVALIIAVVAAFFTGWQGWEAHLARRDAKDAAAIAREDSVTAASQARENFDKQSAIQLEQSRNSARQAERSANAAEQSNRLAREALHITEAAVLDATAALAKPFGANEPIAVTITIRNAGKTTAFDMVGVSRLVAGDLDESRAYDVAQKSQLSTAASHAYLSSGATVQQTLRTANSLQQAEVEQLKAGKLQLFVFNESQYVDVFHQIHKLNYCAFYDTRSDSMSICAGHNHAE